MIRIRALHHVRINVADVARAEAFAVDFGLVRAIHDDRAVYMRGAGRDAYNLVIEIGTSPLIPGIVFAVEGFEDLESAVRDHSATPIRTFEGPFGGQAVSLTDPDGNRIDLVHGIGARASEPLRPTMMVNDGAAKNRRGVTQYKPAVGAPQLLRLGHVGLFVSNYSASDAWYRQLLGLIPSDLMYAGAPDNVIAGFYRLNRGLEWVDHHTIALFGMGRSGLHHLSFEVQDSEAQFMAHRWMTQKGHKSVWGVGRHQRGSHIFDVWRSPDGQRFETFSDTDVCTVEHASSIHPIEQVGLDLWRDDHFDKYFA